MSPEPATQTFTLHPGSAPRQFLVYRPSRSPERAALPVVLMLHGAGATAGWMLEETRWHLTADREGFLVVLPEGLRPDPSRPPDFLNNPQLWNDGSPHSAAGGSQEDELAFLNAVLDEVIRRFPVDKRRVYVTGFSNGGGMAFRFAEQSSARLAALAPVAGYCWRAEPRLAVALPTLYLVGTRDPLVPLAGGTIKSLWTGLPEYRQPVAETLHRWARALGCPPEPSVTGEGEGVRVDRYGPGRDGVRMEVHTVFGLGHHWPGGRGQLNRRLVGPPSDRVNANDLVWSFFRGHVAAHP